PQYLVGAAAEAHQRRYSIQPFEEVADAQAVGTEHIDGQVGDPLAQLAGEDLFDADLHRRDASAVEYRRGLQAHEPGDFDVGLGLREAATECWRRVSRHGDQVVECAPQIARVRQRATLEVQRTG